MSSNNLAGTTKLGRRKRYTIASSIAAVVVAIAIYSAAESNLYKGSKTWNFDSASDASAIDQLKATTGDDSWKIVADSSAPSPPNVLARQPGNQSSPGYHLLAMPDGPYQTNYKATVKFKMLPSGKNNHAVGLVVRLQDQDHYFVLLADISAQRFSLCRFDPGILLCTQDKDAVISSGWHTITAQVSAQGIAGYLDDKLLLQRYDQHYMTGTVGLMTKGDSAALFDDLSIEY